MLQQYGVAPDQSAARAVDLLAEVERYFGGALELHVPEMRIKQPIDKETTLALTLLLKDLARQCALEMAKRAAGYAIVLEAKASRIP